MEFGGHGTEGSTQPTVTAALTTTTSSAPPRSDSGSLPAGLVPHQTVAGELFRLATYFAQHSPNLMVEPPLGGSVTVLQQLTQIRDVIARNVALSRSCLRQSSLLLAVCSVELLLEMFLFLDMASLKTLLLVNVGLRKLIMSHERIWEQACAREFPQWYQRLLLHGERPQQDPKLPQPAGPCKWFVRVRNHVKGDFHWMHSRQDIAVRQCAMPRGLHCIFFDRKELLCGSGSMNEVLVYSWQTGRRRVAGQNPGLVGHTQAVSTIQVLDQDPNLLLTGSLDSTLRLWDRERMACVKVFRGHHDKVWCASSVDNSIYSGGSDKTVRIWNIESGAEMARFEDYRTSVSAVRAMRRGEGNHVVATGSAGSNIRLWDISPSAAVCTGRLRGHQKGIFCLHLVPQFMLSGGLDNLLKVWDPRAGFSAVAVMEDSGVSAHAAGTLAAQAAPALGGGGGGLGFQQTQTQLPSDAKTGIITMYSDDVKVVTGGPEQVVKLWDLRMFRLVSRMYGHTHWVTSVQFDEDKVVSTSRDRTIRFWDMTGRMMDSITLPQE
jgi:hypothetical protein